MARSRAAIEDFMTVSTWVLEYLSDWLSGESLKLTGMVETGGQAITYGRARHFETQEPIIDPSRVMSGGLRLDNIRIKRIKD